MNVRSIAVVAGGILLAAWTLAEATGGSSYWNLFGSSEQSQPFGKVWPVEDTKAAPSPAAPKHQ